MAFSAESTVAGGFVNTGLLTISNAALTVNGIELTSGGTLALAGSASLTDASGTLSNLGLVSVDGGTATFDAASFNNEAGATLAVASGATLVRSGGTAANDGLLTLNGGTLALSGGALFNQNADLTLGTGSAISLDSGTLGGSGTLTIDGAVSFANGGVLALDALNQGTVTTGNSRYDVAGTLTTQGAGTLGLDGAMTLGGGGTFAFSNAVDLTDDTVEAGTTLSVANTATLTDLTVDGTLVAAAGSALTFGGTLGGAGTFAHETSGSTLSTTTDVATLANSGTLTLSGGSLTGLDVENSGVLAVSTLSVVDLDTGGSLANSGTLSIQDTATLNFVDGTLTNTGTIAFGAGASLTTSDATILSAGVIELDSGIGQATVDADLTLTAENVLRIDLGGTLVATEFDQLVANGGVDLGGTLSIGEFGSFAVADGNSFQVIDASSGSLTGSFDLIDGFETSGDLVLDLLQGNDSVTLVGRTVTNPGTSGVDDTLTGTAGDDVFLGLSGNDTIDGGGGRDIMHGGDGDDSFVNVRASFLIADSASFGRLDGGSGFDLVDLSGDTASFDLRVLRGDQLSNVERFDITGAGTATVGLSLGVDTVLSATGGTNAVTGTENALIIDGETGDFVNAFGDWLDTSVASTLATIDGYTVYQSSTTGAELYVAPDVTVNIS